MRLADSDRADHHISADVRPHGAQVAVVERGTGQQIGRGHLVQPVGQPPAKVHRAPQGVAPGGNAAQQHPAAGHGHPQAEQVAGQKHQHRRQHRAGNAVAGLAGVVVVGKKGGQPVHDLQDDHERQGQCLRHPAQPAARAGHQGKRRQRGPGVGGTARCHGRANGTQAALAVHIVDRHVRKARILAQRRHQPRCQQRMAAQVVKKISVAPNRQPRKKPLQRSKQRGFGIGLGRV